jgi:hypothetical protein
MKNDVRIGGTVAQIELPNTLRIGVRLLRRCSRDFAPT